MIGKLLRGVDAFSFRNMFYMDSVTAQFCNIQPDPNAKFHPHPNTNL